MLRTVTNNNILFSAWDILPRIENVVCIMQFKRNFNNHDYGYNMHSIDNLHVKQAHAVIDLSKRYANNLSGNLVRYTDSRSIKK